MVESAAIAPSIESLASARPEDPNSWVLGDNPRVRQIARHAERASEVQCTVLVTGETGTGKEIWARLLHRLGPRQAKPFVPVNCAALTATLAESQLFGHEKGAFTGAAGRSLGVFRAGDGGVVFLDEVGEMPLELQPKLLRVLQQAEVTPVGAARPSRVDVQVIAATNRNLEQEVEEGRFREDLYYRLNMVELCVPSLRERGRGHSPTSSTTSRGSLPPSTIANSGNPRRISCRNSASITGPGNIRQLGHVIEQAYVLDCQPTLPNKRGAVPGEARLPFTDLAKLRRAAVKQALRNTQGHKGRAAKLLGVHPNTMTRLLAQIVDEEQAEKS